MARPRSRTTDFVERDGAIYFALSAGYVAIIDAGDADVLSEKWYAFPSKSNFYAATQRNAKRIMLHRELVKPPRGTVTDHFNGNTLDNRRWNLRLCSRADNAVNIGRPEGSGVKWDSVRGCWFARFTWRGVDHFIGRFADYTEAVLKTQEARQRFMDVDPHFRGGTGATDHALLFSRRRGS